MLTFIKVATHKTDNLWIHYTRLIQFYSVYVGKNQTKPPKLKQKLEPPNPQKSPKQPTAPTR